MNMMNWAKAVTRTSEGKSLQAMAGSDPVRMATELTRQTGRRTESNFMKAEGNDYLYGIPSIKK